MRKFFKNVKKYKNPSPNPPKEIANDLLLKNPNTAYNILVQV